MVELPSAALQRVADRLDGGMSIAELRLSWTTPDNDQQQFVTVRFLTEYAALDEFASRLEQILDGKLDTAALPGTAR